jgi:hypothetical protein
MKKILPITYFSLLFSIQIFAQQVPNGSFETWTNGEPDHWKTSNQSIPFVGSITTVTKDATDSQEGSASAKLTVVTKSIPFVGTYTLPGVLTLGKLNIDIANQTASISGGYPFTGMPDKLTGFIKYQPVNNDQYSIGWGLTKWNNGIRDSIGVGAIYNNSVLNSWTYFEVPIVYLKTETPDTINVLVLNSNPIDGINHTGTILWIDNLSFVYGTVGIEVKAFTNGLRMYADANSHQLIVTSSFPQNEKLDISLVNMTGYEVKHWMRYMQQSTEHFDITNLPPGTYILRISSGTRMIDSCKINILH